MSGPDKMAAMRRTFRADRDYSIDPLIPRFRLIDEATGKLITRLALDREYAPGEEIVFPSIKFRMPG